MPVGIGESVLVSVATPPAKIFMIGVLLGYVTGVVIAFLLDIIFFPGQGHAIHWPPI